MTKEKRAYLEQIEKYYNRSIGSQRIIVLGMTPNILMNYGAAKLPIVMRQSVLTKCIRQKTGSRSAHNLPRRIIESLPESISNPIFLIQDKERHSIALISDLKDRVGNSILVAIRLDEKQKNVQVNEIKSIYGKTNLKEYLLKHNSLNQLYVIDNKKAEMLSRLVGFQLPQALIASSYDKSIPLKEPKVNDKISVRAKLEQYKKEIQAKEAVGPQKQKEKEQPKER